MIFMPCYNEEGQLEAALAELPQTLEGIGEIIHLVVDDGSTDGSVAVARRRGVRVLERPHQGFAHTYRAGLEEALLLEADLIVSLDADAQYDPLALPYLLGPLLEDVADIVIGERDLSHLQGRSSLHRTLHHFGAWTVSQLTGLRSRDPISSYRAYRAEAARALELRTRYCPMLETWVQFAKLNLRVVQVVWPSRHTQRPSRLVRSVGEYVLRQACTLLWSLWVYRRVEARVWEGGRVERP